MGGINLGCRRHRRSHVRVDPHESRDGGVAVAGGHAVGSGLGVLMLAAGGLVPGPIAVVPCPLAACGWRQECHRERRLAGEPPQARLDPRVRVDQWAVLAVHLRPRLDHRVGERLESVHADVPRGVQLEQPPVQIHERIRERRAFELGDILGAPHVDSSLEMLTYWYPVFV